MKLLVCEVSKMSTFKVVTLLNHVEPFLVYVVTCCFLFYFKILLHFTSEEAIPGTNKPMEETSDTFR